MVDGFRAEVQSQLNDLAELMHEFPACRDALGADGGPDVVQAFRDFVAERSAVVGAQMERIATLEAELAANHQRCDAAMATMGESVTESEEALDKALEKLAALEAHNLVLTGRVGELEAENAELRGHHGRCWR